jgi:1-acyl-sn-glycerol-3-phosphate acyltransferase
LLLAWLRGLAMLATFAVIGPLQLLMTAFGRRDVLPPPFLAMIGWLAGLKVRVEGKPAPGTLLLLGNHLSWLDVLALAGVCRSAFVAHAGLAQHGFLKWLCDQNDTVFITRDRRGTVAGQVDQVRVALARRRLAIFPEGTTGDGVDLLPFKSSLLSAVEDAVEGVTVQPVALIYEDAAEIAWVDGEPGMDNVRRILSRTRPVCLTIHFLEPLSQTERADRKAMAAAAREAIARAL